jgi:type IV secretion system protein VirB5
MKFRRPVQRYGRTPEPQTPYQRAAQVWDDRIGSARAQARNWRLMALGELLLATGLSGGLLWQSMQSRVTPYVVAVDRLGEARAIAPAGRNYRPTDPEIAWHLAKFITNVRSISLDPVLMRQDWLSAYDFVTERGARFLNQYARDTSPFADIGTRTVSIQVTSVVRASDRSFEVKWIESEFERGTLAGTSHWTGILSIMVRPPSTLETLRKNPLGLYVDSIDWSRELEPGSPAPAVASAVGAAESSAWPYRPTASLIHPAAPPLPSNPPARSGS